MTANTTKDEMKRSRVVCLVSGGIDSPVAAWLMIRKDCIPVFVYFDNTPFTDETTRERAIEAINRVKKHASLNQVTLHVVPHGDNLAALLRNCPRNLTCILCRRMMYRLAEEIALGESAHSIVTGEIIGEHASQTLTNLRIESDVVSKVAVLRPLVGMNKTEVEKIARKIGTFNASTKPASCCSGPPPKPRTRARFEEIHKAERSLEIRSMIKQALERTLAVSI